MAKEISQKHLILLRIFPAEIAREIMNFCYRTYKEKHEGLTNILQAEYNVWFINHFKEYVHRSLMRDYNGFIAQPFVKRLGDATLSVELSDCFIFKILKQGLMNLRLDTWIKHGYVEEKEPYGNYHKTYEFIKYKCPSDDQENLRKQNMQKLEKKLGRFKNIHPRRRKF